MSNLLEIISHDVRVKRAAATHGGEYAGPCPWCGGNDRFRVWPEETERGRYWCRVCERSGDAIDYLRERHRLSFREACECVGAYDKIRDEEGPTGARKEPREALAIPEREGTWRLLPPNAQWQKRAREIMAETQPVLWSDAGRRARAWLIGRGLSEETIRAAGLGFNPEDRHEDRRQWGLPPGRQIWFPRGIVIPWEIGGDVWRLNVRRAQNNPKYAQPAGGANGLYNADALTGGCVALLCEGEIDALTVAQHAGELVVPVATGSTSGSRKARWIARVAGCSAVLVAFDNDPNEAGENASRYWVETLANAVRWRPYWADANAMAQEGADLRVWISAGVHYATSALRKDGEKVSDARDVNAWQEADELLSALFSEVNGNTSEAGQRAWQSTWRDFKDAYRNHDMALLARTMERYREESRIPFEP